jgi:hypothetical protein
MNGIIDTIITLAIAFFTLSVPTLLGYAIGSNNAKKKTIEMMMKEPMSAFETNYLKEGISIINDFLESMFLKYTHNILVNMAMRDKYIVKNFLNSSVSNLDMNKKTTGFTTYTFIQMSEDLKRLFYRYYNRYDDEGNESDTLIRYITEWYVLRIRKLQMEYTAALGEDMSENHAVMINSRIFTEIEMDLYYRLGIVTTQPSNDNRNTTINKDILR